MLDEVVERRKWITREHFLQLIGITNLLPGPNSSEVTIHIGYTQRGWPGALVTGLSFLLPTFVMVTAFSWLYFTYGSLPQVEPVFWGLKPVIVAIILWAGWRLGRTAVGRPLLLGLAVLGAGVAYFAGGWAVAAMAAGGLVTWLEYRTKGERPGPTGESEKEGTSTGVLGGAEEGPDGDREEEPEGGSGSDGAVADGDEDGATLLPLLLPAPLVTAGAGLVLLGKVFWLHLWIGAVLFGGGYVLVVLLEPFAVARYGWITQAQFLDGVALSQAVPGPISTLSAFVGFGAAGLPGAALATAGIYLPAFAAVLLVAPHLDRLRSMEPVRATLDGVSAVVAGAIVGVGASLVVAAVPDVVAGALLMGTLLVMMLLRVPAPWMVLVGLGAGLLRLLVV